jgi:hypothetical protein
MTKTGAFLAAAALAVVSLLGCAAAKPVTSAAPPAAARALPGDFDLLNGPVWRGTLTYLDYKSQKPVTLKSTLRVSRAKDEEPRWEWQLGYDDEPRANRGETVALAEGGQLFDGEVVVERAALPGGEVRVVTETDGADDEKPARLRHVYTLGPSAASLQKLVRFAGTEAFFERNVYRWTR